MSDPRQKGHQQGVIKGIPAQDIEIFDQMDRQKLYDYIIMQIKNIWRVDGLYFLGIEKRHDMQEATDVDAECWDYMGKVEAREIKKFLGIEDPSPEEALLILRHTSWALSHEVKTFKVEPDGSAVFDVIKCRTQLIRLDKGLEPHPCRQVRERYLGSFVKELSPNLVLECVSCPPERTIDDIWCRWIFKKAG